MKDLKKLFLLSVLIISVLLSTFPLRNTIISAASIKGTNSTTNKKTPIPKVPFLLE